MKYSRLHSREKTTWQFCHEILPHVSRTFALTVPVLPDPLADSVCCAYLLCRMADTIEDRSDLAAPQRFELYSLLAAMVEEPERSDLTGRFLQLWPPVADRFHEKLMRGASAVLGAYASLPEGHARAINRCVQDMIRGMRTMSHGPPHDGLVVISEDLVGLEQYCHYVAGTVGLMLTGLFREHLRPFRVGESADEQGRRFGLGLQLTNILKDHAEDVARGTTFIPPAWCKGGRPAEGIDPLAKGRLIQRALNHLKEAQEYTLDFPADAEGIRLFCLWALWMAVATLREVGRSLSQPKITRLEVASIVEYTRRFARDNAALQRRYLSLHHEAWEAAQQLLGGVHVAPSEADDFLAGRTS